MNVGDLVQQPQAAPDEVLAVASRGDWRELCRLGRFGLAAQTLRLVGDPAIDEWLPLLVDLQAVERHVQRKEFAAALARIETLLAAPDELIDPPLLGVDLQRLTAASEAIDRREFDVARVALADQQSDAFAAEVATLQGTIAVLEGDSTAASALFDAALARDHQHIRALTNRGNLKLEANDTEGAIADYEAALRIDDTFANAHHNLGVAYRRQGKISKSVAALRRAQRSSLRQEADSARQNRRNRQPGSSSANRSRWLWWGLVILIGLWFARQQGLI
jgi:tetratricopeptide (TPR) repeat protein